VLADALPASTWLLLDGSARRTDFLRDAIVDLEMSDRVSVIAARAEDAGRDPALRAAFDAVVARGFGPPPNVVEAAAPFLSVGGVLVVSEPPQEPDTDRWPEAALAEVGLANGLHLDVGSRFFVARQRGRCPDRYPRRWPHQRRKPLYKVPRGTGAERST
jgi:16S rRNA (guanine527-N7)-methyltransferase